MCIGEVQANRSGFVEHKVFVDQDRNQTIGIERQKLCRLMGLLLSVDRYQLILKTQLFQQNVRHHTGSTSVMMKLQHERFLSVF